METEITKVEKSLKDCFGSASDIYVDPDIKACEVTISIDDFHGELAERIIENGVFLTMIDYSDIYPYKYVFNYMLKD